MNGLARLGLTTRLALALVTGALFPLVLGAPSTFAAQDEGEVVALVREYVSLLRQSDPKLEPLLAEDYVETSSAGLVYGKAELVQRLQAIATTASAEIHDVRARNYGDMAIVTARVHFTYERSGEQVLVRNRYTFTCVRRDGTWRIASTHFSIVRDAASSVQNLVTFEILPVPEAVKNHAWVRLLEDPAGDGSRADSADGKALFYSYDAVADQIWFKLELHSEINVERPAVSISLDIDADQATGSNWYGANAQFKYDRILNFGPTQKQQDGRFVGYNGITTDQGARSRNWLDDKKGNLTFYLDAAGKAYYLGVRRTDIAANLRRFHLIGSVGANSLWNDDIGDKGFATIELPESSSTSQSDAVSSAAQTEWAREYLRFYGLGQRATSQQTAQLSAFRETITSKAAGVQDRQKAFEGAASLLLALLGQAASPLDRFVPASSFARTAHALAQAGPTALPNRRASPRERLGHVQKTGRGPIPMILISDFNVDWSIYKSFMERNASRYTMYAVTLPGFGGSPAPPVPESFDPASSPWLDNAERGILRMVEENKLRKPVVVGTAAGVYLAARLAANHPDKFGSAVLINGAVHFSMRDPRRPDHVLTLSERRALMASSLAYNGMLHDLLPPAQFVTLEAVERALPDLQVNPLAYTPGLLVSDRNRDKEIFARGLLGSVPGTHRYTIELGFTDLSEDMRRLSVPTLALSSRFDAGGFTGFTSHDHWRASKLRSPGIPLTSVLVHDAQTYLAEDIPQEIDDAIQRFLSGGLNVVSLRKPARPSPRTSPLASVTQVMGASQLEVSYSRPRVNARPIWGRMVPYGRVWRTGANEATTFSSSKDILVEGQRLPAGAYSLFTIPGESEWTIIFNKIAVQFGSFNYNSEFDALRVQLKPQAAEHQEWMQFSFEDISPKSARLTLHWEKLRVPVLLEEGASDNPAAARLVTSDIASFWKVVDRATPERLVELLKTEYLDIGSAGLKGFIPHRIVSAEALASTFRERRARYEEARANSLRIGSIEQAIRAPFFALKKLYPDAVFPDVFFVIGRLNSGGTALDRGLVIGAEMYLDVEELPGIVAHELVHYQQANIPDSARTLLAQSLMEGSADFIGELISGKHINKKAFEYGRAHEKELWAEFQGRMLGQRTEGWLYGKPPGERPSDLGYFIGYQIAKAYYDRVGDKRAAVRNIIRMRDYEAFLAASGYNPRELAPRENRS
ncbi:MAG: alpha/beta fold hydrolase [Acidobacteria bacterium]|nr:alpha/beta fold hydrolase [Acidobacteriota bacterium]